jgi:hypothetical protein
VPNPVSIAQIRDAIREWPDSMLVRVALWIAAEVDQPLQFWQDALCALRGHEMPQWPEMFAEQVSKLAARKHTGENVRQLIFSQAPKQSTRGRS